MPGRTALGPEEGELVWLGGIGVRFMISGQETEGRFSLVEHPLKPRALAAPLHTHAREDEFSFILEGEVGMQLGHRELVAGAGMLVFKPRGVPHTFWNPTERPARLLEIISPAGFERYFAELAELLGGPGPVSQEQMEALQARYALQVDLHSLPGLRERHGVKLRP